MKKEDLVYICSPFSAKELGIPIYQMIETGISGFILVQERKDLNEM